MSEKLILYGAGRYGVFAALVLSAAGSTPCCFCDKNQANSTEPITGLPIISPQALMSDYPDTKIMITAFTQKVIDDIYVDLEALGIDRNRVSQFYSLRDALIKNNELINYISRYGFIHKGFLILSSVLKDDFKITDDLVKLKDFYLPYDNKSPYLFDEYAIQLLTFLSGLPYSRNNVGIVDSIITNHAYLLDEVDIPMILHRNDIVIDAGAWYGEFSLLAAKVFNANVYAFEPSDANYEKLLKTIAINSCNDRIQAIKSGLGDRTAQLRFENNPVHSDDSKISAKGDALVNVTSIDNFVTENGLTHVDFIKADIEGYERKLLKGATMTLREFAPKLSLCSYHFPDDPIVLRALIKKANPSYKFEQRKNILFAWVTK